MNKASLYLLALLLFACTGSNTPATKDNRLGQNAKSGRLLSFDELLRARRFSSLQEAFQATEPVYKLVIYGKKLQVLTDSIGLLRSLNTLELTRNNLQSLPDSLRHLKFLQSLYLAENNFTSIPDVIEFLPSLTRLNLAENPISKFDGLEKAKQVQELNLSRLKLEQLPGQVLELDSLSLLNLRANNISELPQGIGKLQNLRSLNLSKNKLSSLPIELAGLKKLEVLNLEGNAFPKDYVRGFQKHLPDTKIKF